MYVYANCSYIRPNKINNNDTSLLFFFFTGVPLVIVSLVLAIDKDVYGNVSPEDAAVALESDQPL